MFQFKPLISLAGAAAAMMLFGNSVQAADIYNNLNNAAIQSGTGCCGGIPAIFTVPANGSVYVAEIDVYVQGGASVPPTIILETVVGNIQRAGTQLTSGIGTPLVKGGYTIWRLYPNMTLTGGAYAVDVHSNSGWLQNATSGQGQNAPSGHVGFVVVRSTKQAPMPLPPQPTSYDLMSPKRYFEFTGVAAPGQTVTITVRKQQSSPLKTISLIYSFLYSGTGYQGSYVKLPVNLQSGDGLGVNSTYTTSLPTTLCVWLPYSDNPATDYSVYIIFTHYTGNPNSDDAVDGNVTSPCSYNSNIPHSQRRWKR